MLEFRVSENELLKRLKSRGRADDTEDVILNRMKVYRDETAPLLDYYQRRAQDRRRRRHARRGVRAGTARRSGTLDASMIGLPGLRNRKVVAQRSAGELDAMAAAGALVPRR